MIPARTRNIILKETIERKNVPKIAPNINDAGVRILNILITLRSSLSILLKRCVSVIISIILAPTRDINRTAIHTEIFELSVKLIAAEDNVRTINPIVIISFSPKYLSDNLPAILGIKIYGIKAIEIISVTSDNEKFIS